MTKSSGSYIHARISDDLLADLKRYSEKEDRSMSYIIRKSLEKFLQTDDSSGHHG